MVDIRAEHSGEFSTDRPITATTLRAIMAGVGPLPSGKAGIMALSCPGCGGHEMTPLFDPQTGQLLLVCQRCTPATAPIRLWLAETEPNA